MTMFRRRDFLTGMSSVGTVMAGSTFAATQESTPIRPPEVAEWQFPSAGNASHFWAPPLVHEDTVFIGGEDYEAETGTLYAVELSSGEPVWQYDVPLPIWATPTVTNETVCFGTGIDLDNHDGSIHAIDVTSQSQQWKFSGFSGTPDPTLLASDDQAVYFYAREERAIYALDLATGNILWRYPSNGKSSYRLDAPLLISEGTLYAGETAIDAQSGDLLWNLASVLQGGLAPQPVLTENALFIGGENVISVVPDSGKANWRASENSSLTAMYPFEGKLFIAEFSGSDMSSDSSIIHALNQHSGEVQWSQQIQGAISSLQVLDGTLYAGSHGGNIYAIGPKTGTLRWSAHSEWNVNFYLSRHTRNGHVIASTSGGRLYSITEPSGPSSSGASSSGSSEDTTGSTTTESPTSKSESNTPVDVILRQTFGSSGSPAWLSLAGVGGLGAAYLGYRAVRNRLNKTSTGDVVTEVGPTSEGVVIPEYSNLEFNDPVVTTASVQLRKATTNKKTLWIASPLHEGDQTIKTSHAEQFLNSVRPWSQLPAHQHLLTTYAVRTDPIPWAAIEPTEAPTISARRDALSTDALLNVFVQVCDAVHHVRRHGMSYTALSPAGVLVGPDGTATLRGAVDELIIDTDNAYQLPNTEEPEATESADIYRVGALIYEVLLGIRPNDPDAPAPSTTSYPIENIDTVVPQALAERPDDRYDTLVHLRDELQNLM